MITAEVAMPPTNRIFEAFSSRPLAGSYRACSRPTRRCALLARNLLLFTVTQGFHCSLPTMGVVRRKRIPVRRLLANLVKDESGVTAVEYALIAALIAVAAIASFTLIGTRLSTTFSTVGGKL